MFFPLCLRTKKKEKRRRRRRRRRKETEFGDLFLESMSSLATKCFWDDEMLVKGYCGILLTEVFQLKKKNEIQKGMTQKGGIKLGPYLILVLR